MRTWSGAPANVAACLERQGVGVVGIETSLGRLHQAWFAGTHLFFRYGQIGSSEAIARGPAMRWSRARSLSRELTRLGIMQVLHTGTLDLQPAADEGSITHYLLCDHTWNLSLRHRPDLGEYSDRAIRLIDEAERAAYGGCRHIFTFGDYVRADLIAHYGVAPGRVTVVGSGMGNIAPYAGPKDYARGRLLFIAKHYFFEKGGPLLLDAFRIALRNRPDLTLTVVGNGDIRGSVSRCRNVQFRPYVPWSELQTLLREATLLVQPMLNDPWGQVYLEALVSRTPVIGLDRNGLPEIIQNGRFGFLVGDATPEALVEAILDATADPARLADMGLLGQDHVLRHFSWDRVAEKIRNVVGRPEHGASCGVLPGTPPSRSAATPLSD